MAWCF